jgi:hypothetical protein
MINQIRANWVVHHLVAGLIIALALPLASCGGGKNSGSSSPPTRQNPIPGITSISPFSAPAGSRALTLTVKGSNFINGSVIQWNGTARNTVYVSSTQLTASINPADLSSTGNSTVTVLNPAPGGGTSGSFTFFITAVSPLTILTTSLPDAYHSKTYNYALQASGGIQPYSWSVTGGSLPNGLNLASNGGISGTPPVVTSVSTAGITITVSDNAFQPITASRSFNLVMRPGNLGRNDTCSTATHVSNGIIRASISPYGDIDVYAFQGAAGNQVTAEIYAQRLTIHGDPTSTDVFMDSFLEILDSTCARLTYNDDIISGVSVDSLISNYALPYSGTYYIRISDLRGDGRPDFIYELHLSGANQ